MKTIQHAKSIKLTLLLALLVVVCQSSVFTVPLEYRMFLNEHLELKIPPTWKVVTEEDILRQFPQDYLSSQICYENGEHPWLGVRQQKKPMSQDSLEQHVNTTADRLRLDYYGFMDILSHGTELVNGRKLGFIEFVIHDTYTLVFITDVEGMFVECGFECDKKQMAEWVPVAKEMMHSVKVH